MSFFSRFKKKNTVKFEKVAAQPGFTLETENGDCGPVTEQRLGEALIDLARSQDGFVVLTAPHAVRDVRYVQACTSENGVHFEIGIEKEDTRLYEKQCTVDECRRCFFAFLRGEFDPDPAEYKPAEF